MIFLNAYEPLIDIFSGNWEVILQCRKDKDLVVEVDDDDQSVVLIPKSDHKKTNIWICLHNIAKNNQDRQVKELLKEGRINWSH